MKLTKSQFVTLRRFKEHYDKFPNQANAGWMNTYGQNLNTVHALYKRQLIELPVVPRGLRAYRITEQGKALLAQIESEAK